MRPLHYSIVVFACAALAAGCSSSSPEPEATASTTSSASMTTSASSPPEASSTTLTRPTSGSPGGVPAGAITVMEESAFVSRDGSMVCLMQPAQARAICQNSDGKPVAATKPCPGGSEGQVGIFVAVGTTVSLPCMNQGVIDAARTGTTTTAWRIDPHGMWVTVGGRTLATLTSGETLRGGPIDCTVTQSTVTCRNPSTRATFTIKRGGYTS